MADMLQAKTTHAQAVLNRVKAEGEANNARGALAVSMGLDANTPLSPGPLSTTLVNTAFVHSVDALIEDVNNDSKLTQFSCRQRFRTDTPRCPAVAGLLPSH